jgi:gliding motility-associated-like protein
LAVGKTGNTINRVQLLFVLAVVLLSGFKTVPTVPDPLLVTISNPDAHPCPGQPVKFTASVTNGSSNLFYQWQVNGVNIGPNSPSFTIANDISNPIKKTDVIQCLVTDKSNGATATSNKLSGIEVLVTEDLFFNIFIQNNLPVCPGTQILMGSEQNNLYRNGVSSLVGVWSVNGVPVHQGLTFVYDSPKDGDVITCEATYTAKCITKVVESNSVTVRVTTQPPTTVTVSPADYNGCVGTPVTFNATVTNGGNTKYQWILNGQNVGTGAPQFTSSELKTGDQVSCNVTTNRPCLIDHAQSNVVTAIVLPQITNAVSITCDAVNNFIVENQLVTFTAQPTYSGTVDYQWQVNGKAVGTNSPVFKDNSLTMGDIVTCTTTTTGACVLPASANSNSITILMHVPLSIPNAFTPNGDGINDTWNIKALLIYPTCSVRIFDRYGGQVYQSVGYSRGWDGTTNNRQLPTGVYYYLINLNDGTPPYSGYVTIIR